MKSDIDYLRNLLGQDVLLLPVRRDTKKPTGKWRHLTIADMANPKHLTKLNRAANIGVVLGEVSGGLCSIDIDDDAQVEPFLGLNPLLKGTLCSKGKRGCNYWVRLVGDYPRTHQIKAEEKNIGEFRANGAYTLIHGTHPDGMNYRILNEVAPVEIAYDSIKWFEKSKHTPPPTTSSDKLNTEPCTLYNKSNNQHDNPPDTASILANIEARKTAEASFKRTHPSVAELYADIVESRFRAIAGGRNSFLTEAVPFLYRAVSPAFILPLMEHFYLCNQSLFNDPLENHMKEATAMMEGVSASYLNDLGEGEKAIYTALQEREQNLFRLCRDLALTNAEKGGRCAFFAPMDKFGWRLGLKGMQVGRDLKTLEGYGIIRCIEKGKLWAKGAKAMAGTYAWLV
ncbi:bifunctional DNA primase/polymerase [Verrucomicrobia bacterium]|nr:bifunctional DNA primase/polymerase [Verrucomicrobiota bacterium]